METFGRTKRGYNTRACQSERPLDASFIIIDNFAVFAADILRV